MALFFKFHSLEDLQTENVRLGLDLRFSDDLSPLFRPRNIGPLRVGNSLCIQPMEGCDGTLDGRPDELTFRRYVRFGAGGAKLIWGEATAHSAPFYAKALGIPNIQDHFFIRDSILDACRLKFSEKFFGQLAEA